MRNVALVGVLVGTTAVGGASAQPSGASPVAGAASAQPAPTAVLASVQQHYANANQMTARFRQTVTSAPAGTTTTTDGKLYVARPAQLRWDYYQKVRKLVTVTRSLIVDGPTLWLVDHDTQQIVQALAQTSPLPAAVSFLTDAGNLGAQFEVALETSGVIGGAGATVLALTPKQVSAPYAKLYFVVDPSSGYVTQSIVIDASGDTTTFTFQAANLTSPVNPRWFQVSPSSLPTYTLVVGAPGAGAGTATPAAPSPTGAGSAATPTP